MTTDDVMALRARFEKTDFGRSVDGEQLLAHPLWVIAELLAEMRDWVARVDVSLREQRTALRAIENALRAP